MSTLNNTGAIRKERKFVTSWQDEEAFKGWLAPHPTENKAFCTFCQSTIRCCKSDLLRHSQRTKHIQLLNNVEQSPDHSYNIVLHSDKVKRAEIKLAAFYAEHNAAFSAADHLIPLLKNICIDSKIAQDLSLVRKQCTGIIENVIAKHENEKLIDIIKKCKFSILIDESTDFSDTKIMCVLVQFLSPDFKVQTRLLDLISLDARNCRADNIYKLFKESLENKNVPISNIVGMASDNASVMIGRRNSFCSHLKADVPNLVVLNCICHSSALIAHKACEKLPHACENLMKSIATYISGSAKRCAVLVEFQEFFNVEKNKTLKLTTTRWLVIHKCVIRMLNNWDVLKHYFIVAVVEDKTSSAETILTNLNDDNIKAYLLFLKYSLTFFNNFNALFQSREILIHKLFKSSQRIIHQFGLNFMTPEALMDLNNLNVNQIEQLKSLKDVYVGPECQQYLATMSTDCVDNIKLTCLNFYKTALEEMLNRLPCNDSFFKHLSFLDPKVALFDNSRTVIEDLSFIAMQIGNIDVSKLSYEWRILPSLYNDLEKKELATLKINEMWKKIFEYTDFDNEKLFQNLELLVEAVLSLPQSNAEAERIFSMMFEFKNKKRNRLSTSTI